MPVDYHAWTHRPKSEGGTDPISIPEPIIEYAYIAQILDQEEPWPTGEDNNPITKGPMTEGFTSNEEVLYPDLSDGAIYLHEEGGGLGATTSSPGYYVAACSAVPDSWSGPSNPVLDGIKGSGIYWDCATLDQRALVVDLEHPSGTLGVPDGETNCSDSNIVQAAALNRIQPWFANYTGVDVFLVQCSLFVALIKPYLFIPEGFGTPSTAVGTRTPHFGKWYVP